MSLVTVSKIQKESAATNIDVPSTGQFIDLASAAQGDVLYYNGTSYVRLGAGTSGQVLTSGGAGANPSWAGGGLFSSYAIIADQKAAGTDGGTFTSGSWQIRDLQTEISDPDGIVSISANTFTLAAGSYLINWNCCGFMCNSHKSRLYDVTGAATLGMGMPQWTIASNHGSNNSEGSARTAPSGSNVYRIEHRCSSTKADQGFGVPAGFSEPEIFTYVEIYKES